MYDVIAFWADHIVRYVPIVTWVGLLLAMALAVIWFTKRWSASPVLALVCVLYAFTPYMPTASSL